MDFLHIIIQMLMIFGIVLVGLFAAKRNLWASELDRKLSIFIMNISMPALFWLPLWGMISLLKTKNSFPSASSRWLLTSS